MARVLEAMQLMESISPACDTPLCLVDTSALFPYLESLLPGNPVDVSRAVVFLSVQSKATSF